MVSSVKVICNKLTCQSEGYGFVEFLTRAAAEEVLQNFNGSVMPNSEQLFRLNWASFSTGEKRAVENGPELSIFVGDLSPDVTDTLLQELFVERYPSVKSAKVVIDSNTDRSKGYGFVRFGDESERTMEVLCICGQWISKEYLQWEFLVDLKRNASIISIEEDLLYEDLMKIVSEDFSVKEEEFSLSYDISLDMKCIIESFPPLSI
uniref:RRM domain-containing protein n=1 Tax=Brassica oleracea var. oleracea TaxID=109376 RepID=A0A0D2ZU56_BRAOL